MRRALLARAALALLVLATALPVASQTRPRVRVVQDAPVEGFWAESVVALPTATALPAGNLNVTIFHAFAPLDQGPAGLFGLDGPANIRFGLDAGLTDAISVGVGRSRFDKLYDARAKAVVMRQTESGSVPLSVALATNAALTTEPNEIDVVGDLSYGAALVVERHVGDRLSLLVAPTLAHANTVVARREDGAVVVPENQIVALGLAAQLRVTAGMALTAEALPVLSPRSPGTTDAVSFGAVLDTGGHVFQLFVATSAWTTPQHTVARTTGGLGDLRLGFNVNRVFGL